MDVPQVPFQVPYVEQIFVPQDPASQYGDYSQMTEAQRRQQMAANLAAENAVRAASTHQPR